MRQFSIEMYLSTSLRKEERAAAKAIARALKHTATTRNGRVKPNTSALLRSLLREAMIRLHARGEIELTPEQRENLFAEIRRGNPEFGRKE